jgi:uncharacterized membrane protein YeiB
VEQSKVTRRLLYLALAGAAIGYAYWAYGNTIWPWRQPPTSGAAPGFPFPGFQLAMLRRLVAGFFDWGTLGSSLVYATLLLLAWQRPRGARILRPLAATGRMALTTYLTQSVVCTFLFFSFGLGRYGHLSHTGMLLISLVLFPCQMFASTWWLQRFRFGPAEWLWRKLAYGKVPVMRLHRRADPDAPLAAGGD